MPQTRDQVLLNLATFRENLKKMMNPQVLEQFAKFLEATANEADNGSMLERYKWFCEKSEDGPDCRYAGMAKEFFLKNQAQQVADAIKYLYENWAKFYK